MNVRLLYLLGCIVLSGCVTNVPEVYSIPDNAEHLIAGDSSKVWKIARRYNGEMRMNMGDCFMGYRQYYSRDGFVSDNNAQMRDCGPSLTATWEITSDTLGHSYIKLESDQLPALLGQESTEKLFKIKCLTRDSLTVSFTHRQYNKIRTITDYLVREDLDIGDRYFHW